MDGRERLQESTKGFRHWRVGSRSGNNETNDRGDSGIQVRQNDTHVVKQRPDKGANAPRAGSGLRQAGHLDERIAVVPRVGSSAAIANHASEREHGNLKHRCDRFHYRIAHPPIVPPPTDP